MDKLYTIIMAAGKGSRMKTNHSKLIQKVHGKEMIKRVVETAEQIGSEDIITIVGHKKEEVKETLKEFDNITYVEQNEQKGTGDATKKALPPLEGKEGRVIILYGDVPLIRVSTIKTLIERNIRDRESITILTANMSDPTGYGRIIRDKCGSFECIKEQYELSEEEEEITEINAGIYCVDLEVLRETVLRIEPNEVSGEYNLPEIVAIAKEMGLNIGTYNVEDTTEILGVNDRTQLEVVTKIMQHRMNNYYMKNGVSIEDKSSVYIYDDVTIGKDTIISPNTVIKKGCTIGENCIIGHNSYIPEYTEIPDGTVIEDNTIYDK